MSTISKKIFLDDPNIGEIEKKYLAMAVDAGYVSTAGPFVSEFEKTISGYIKAESAVSVQSGTAAIYMALYELGIGRGDEVIVPALTFVATVNPVLHIGAEPVFADVDIKTWNIDPGSIRECITERTKAIVPVHFYGNPCDMDEILKIAGERGIYVIEDATESLGALYKGKHTGTLGDFGCFSFNGNKIITTGGGGMITGKESDKLSHIRTLSNQAKDAKREGYYPEPGFNYRMTNIEAAIGLAQFTKLEKFLEKKRRFNEIYWKELEGTGRVHFQKEYPGGESSFWMSCCRFEEKTGIESLRERLKEKDIVTRRVFMPVTEFPAYNGAKKYDCTNSYRIYGEGLCLPSSTLNSEEDIFYVCERIKDIISAG